MMRAVVWIWRLATFSNGQEKTVNGTRGLRRRNAGSSPIERYDAVRRNRYLPREVQTIHIHLRLYSKAMDPCLLA